MYEELITALREAPSAWRDAELHYKAANAIEELLKAAKAMHTWIFLNTGDEQKAYVECGLSDEMNAALGYSGQCAIDILDDAQTIIPASEDG